MLKSSERGIRTLLQVITVENRRSLTTGRGAITAPDGYIGHTDLHHQPNLQTSVLTVMADYPCVSFLRDAQVPITVVYVVRFHIATSSSEESYQFF
jgi:hypothetical protein